ncbi:hypothetical protein BGZ72_001099 [Mortierella alpina]|nr:hypothetical protein BGZ72_001099 [Mortierella alpina]
MINRFARKRELKEAQEEREDQQLVQEERLQWEEAEALIDTKEDPDLQMALAPSRSLEDGRTKRPRSLSSTPSVGPSTLMLMSAEERDAWDEAQRHKRRLKDMNSIMGMQYKMTQELDDQVWKQDRKLWEIQQENLDLKQRIAEQEQQIRRHQQHISDQQQTIDTLQLEQPPLGTLIRLGRDQHKRRKGRMLGRTRKELFFIA